MTDATVAHRHSRPDPAGPGSGRRGAAAMNAGPCRSLSIQRVFSAGVASSGEEDRLTLERQAAARQPWSTG